MEDKLAKYRLEDPQQLDLFHYLDDPIITENKLPKLNLNKDETLENLANDISTTNNALPDNKL